MWRAKRQVAAPMPARLPAGVPVPSGGRARPLARERTRVFLVCDCPYFYPPFTAGGTEKQLSDLATALGAAGVDVTVVARECSFDTPAADDRSHGLTIQYVGPRAIAKGNGWAALRPNLRFIANALRLLAGARDRYDVLLVSGFRQLGPPLALLARLLRKRCIVRIESAWDLEDHLTRESSQRIGRAGQLLVTAAIRSTRFATFSLAHQIVAFTDELRGRLLSLGVPRGKVAQVPNGIDTDRFAPVDADTKRALRSRLALPAERTIYVYTGRICRSKGVLDLLQAWRLCLEQDDTLLLLVGSGDGSHDRCDEEAARFAREYPGRIALTGRVANVAEYLQAADAFIFLSHQEACSLSLLEALSAGLPCIATDVGGAREVIGHHETGALVAPQSSPDIIGREVAWLRSCRAAWPSMGARARARVMEYCGLRAVAGRYAELLDAARVS
jgi:glycosyltransferase involved in cell wall biosynthesis